MAELGDMLEEVKMTVKEHMFARGISSFRSVSRACKRADFNGNGKLDPREFDECLRSAGVFLSKPQIGLLMRAYDIDGDGSINANEFLMALKGDMNATRQALVDKAFARLDKDGSGVVNLVDIRGVFNASAHPDVKEGKKSEEDVLTEFLDGFEGMCGDADGNVTRDEFNEYYSELSASIPLDAYFVTMMESAWMITLDDTPEDAKKLDRFEQMLRDKIEERTHGSESGNHALKRIFRFFDKDSTGKLTMDEFGAAMLRVGIPIERRLVSSIFDHYDADGSGTVSYDEFADAVYRKTEMSMASTSFM